MFKRTILATLIGLTILSGCSNPSSDDPALIPEAVTGQAVIQSISLEAVTPVETVSGRALVSGDSGYAEQEYYHPEINPGNLSESLVLLLREYVGTQSISLGTVVELPAKAAVTIASANGQSQSVDVGASKLLIKVVDNEVYVYWNTQLDFGAGLEPTHVQIRLQDFSTGVITDYKKISAWFDIVPSDIKVYAHYDVVTDECTSYQYAPEVSENWRVEVYKSGRANGGVYMTLIRMDNEAPYGPTARNWAFGDGNRVAIHAALGVGVSEDESLAHFTQYEEGETRYYVNDELVTTTITAADKAFLDTGLAANTAPVDKTAFNAPGTEYYRLFDATDGVFDTEMETDTVLN